MVWGGAGPLTEPVGGSAYTQQPLLSFGPWANNLEGCGQSLLWLQRAPGAWGPWAGGAVCRRPALPSCWSLAVPGAQGAVSEPLVPSELAS